MTKLPNFINDGQAPELWYIEWLDHSVHADEGTWFEVEHSGNLEPVLVHSVGWLITELHNSVVLVSTMCEDNITGRSRCILKSCINRAVKLKDPMKWS